MTKLLKRKSIMGPVHKIKDIRINDKPIEEVNPFNIESDCLFFSDLHLHDRKEFTRIDPAMGLNVRLMEGLQILEQITDIARKYKIKRVYHLGDVFELKDKVPNHILKEFKIRLMELRRVTDLFLTLLGNHDFNIPNYSTLDVFEKGEWFDLIDRPVNLDMGYFIPYQRRWEDFKTMWKEAHDAKPKLICMHQEIAGSEYETGKKAAGIWDLNIDPNILYLSGHMHKPQKVHGIQYLGSPCPTKFEAYEGDYYIWLYNSKTQALKPLKLNYSKFITLNFYELYEGPTKKDIEEIVKNNYIRIVGEVNKEDIDQKIKMKIKDGLENQFGAKAVVFQVKIKHQTQSKISKKLIDDDKGIIAEYAKNNVEGTSLELKKLVEIGERAYEST